MGDTALLVMDVQRAIVERYVNEPTYLSTLARAISSARSAGVPVIYLTVSFRRNYPEISERNSSFSGVVAAGRLIEGDQGTNIHPAVAPASGDVIVVKRRVSAFVGTDLDILLRARNVDHLVLCGIATSGVVLSTLRNAADLDYDLTVLGDGCVDGDPELHRMLLQRVFPTHARVVTVVEWTADPG
jgi:nicotinamidase-related amidase